MNLTPPWTKFCEWVWRTPPQTSCRMDAPVWPALWAWRTQGSYGLPLVFSLFLWKEPLPGMDAAGQGLFMWRNARRYDEKANFKGKIAFSSKGGYFHSFIAVIICNSIIKISLSKRFSEQHQCGCRNENNRIKDSEFFRRVKPILFELSEDCK